MGNRAKSAGCSHYARIMQSAEHSAERAFSRGANDDGSASEGFRCIASGNETAGRISESADSSAGKSACLHDDCGIAHDDSWRMLSGERPSCPRNRLIDIRRCGCFAICFVGVKIEHDTGYYECPECGKRYVPTMKAVVMALHRGTARKMTCPFCGKCAYHQKVLAR